ncbi:MAG: hypothetical protein ACXVA9_07830 [Bdellovibrionales bacterium]
MKSLLALLLFHSLSHADFFHGPLSSSMGGTGRAAMNSPEGAFLNPALVPLMKDYEFDTHYRDGLLDPGQHRTSYGVGAGDNTKEVLFPGAFHYLRLRGTGQASAPTDSELFHVAVGKNFGGYSVGVSGYRMSSKVDRDREYVQWNYSLGFLALINEDMGVAYVLKNIAKPGGDVPAGLREDLQQGVGYFASLGTVARVRVDITREETGNIDKKLSYMIGCENLASEFGVFRVGYRRDDRLQQDYLTLGAGLEGPRLKIDYAFEKNLKGTAEALHSVDMRLPF